MAAFVRRLEDGRCDALIQSPLFERLSKDPKVFPAIRDNRIDFYYGGGKLFSFDGSFMTHIKYASVYDANGRNCVRESDLGGQGTGDQPREGAGRNYVRESDLGGLRPIRTFDDDWAYDRMKENCKLYAGVEASGVSEIYEEHSFRSKGKVIVLDIEIAFSTKGDEPETDMGPHPKAHERIDLLLFHTIQGTLRFIEAKHFSNPDLWARPGKDPRVMTQLRGYERELKRRQREPGEIGKTGEILEQYCEYTKLINRLFGKELLLPKRVDSHVALLIFGFGADEKAGRLGKLGLKGVKQYARGLASGVNAETLWRETT